jgi:hypothetical protein
MRALDEALEDDARTITQEIIERNALSAVKCESIAQEAVEGESRLTNQGNAFTRLLRLLGFTDSSPEINNSATQDQSPNEGKTVPRLPRPVGRRSPRRDPVGRK